MFFVLSFFAFTSLTTVDLFMMERKMVMREVRGERERERDVLASLTFCCPFTNAHARLS